MRILVTGGTGFVGRTLCPALLAADHEVCVSVRNPRAAEVPDGVEVRPVSDLGPDTDWGAALGWAWQAVAVACAVVAALLYYLEAVPAAGPETQPRPDR